VSLFRRRGREAGDDETPELPDDGSAELDEQDDDDRDDDGEGSDRADGP